MTRSSSSRMRCSIAAFCAPASGAVFCCPQSGTQNKTTAVPATRVFFILCSFDNTWMNEKYFPLLERETEMSHYTARLQKMRAAERGMEVVKCNLIRQIRDFYRGDQPPLSLRMKKVVRADRHIEQIARLHPVGIVIVIFFSGLRQRQQ